MSDCHTCKHSGCRGGASRRRFLTAHRIGLRAIWQERVAGNCHSLARERRLALWPPRVPV